jgi:hypothetical protein
MNAEALVRIFEPIKRAATVSIERSSERSGLGLYNVLLYAKRLGGTVDCVSAPERGTRFLVRLPGPVVIAPRPYAGPRRTEKLVAILSADKLTASALETLFENEGIEAYGDYDALRWLTVVTDFKKPPDLILMDDPSRRKDRLLQIDVVRRRWPNKQLRLVFISNSKAEERGHEQPLLQVDLPISEELRAKLLCCLDEMSEENTN